MRPLNILSLMRLKRATSKKLERFFFLSMRGCILSTASVPYVFSAAFHFSLFLIFFFVDISAITVISNLWHLNYRILHSYQTRESQGMVCGKSYLLIC